MKMSNQKVLKELRRLSEEDRVVIFYSHNADTITFEAMDMIFKAKAQVSKYKILCGNAEKCT